MRTLQIGDEWPTERAGGLNSYFFELLRHLPGAGVSAKGLVVGSEAVAQQTAGEVISFARPGQTLLSRLRAVRRAALAELKKGNVDVLVPHFALYGVPLLDEIRSRPTVTHFHGPWSAESGVEGATGLSAKSKALLESTLYKRADRLIVLSRAFGEVLRHDFQIPEERIRVVPGGVDLDRFHVGVTKAEARHNMGWPLGRPILLSVRRQVRRMGLEVLVDAFSEVVKTASDALLLLGGSGPLVPELERQILERGLQHNVRCLGRISDEQLPLAYRAADLSVVPSQSLEGFGLITLESLASGTPVVVTPVGGLPDVLGEFAPQCIFGGTDALSIASLLTALLTGKETLPSEEACRRHCEANFSWNYIAQQVASVYREVM